MKAIVVLALIAAVLAGHSHMPEVAKLIGDDPQWPHFAQFVQEYKRDYTSVHEVHSRFNIFKLNMVRAAQLSKENPEATFGVNLFADVHPEEFARTHLMPRNVTESLREWHESLPSFYNDENPQPAFRPGVGKDWSSVLTPVKDQGQCGSCWAFSATETIESSLKIKGQSIPPLAPQQIVDCDTAMQGCNGGDPRQAINYVTQQGGIMAESAYPYRAVQGSCKFKAASVVGRTTGALAVTNGNEAALQSFLQASGPPSVAVDASTWSSYRSGILTSCGSNVDHAVQATALTNNVYTVRNSWSTAWGEAGFIRLRAGVNLCQIAYLVSWAK